MSVDDLTVLDRGHNGYGGDVGSIWDRVDPTTKALTGVNVHICLSLYSILNLTQA